MALDTNNDNQNENEASSPVEEADADADFDAEVALLGANIANNFNKMTMSILKEAIDRQNLVIQKAIAVMDDQRVMIKQQQALIKRFQKWGAATVSEATVPCARLSAMSTSTYNHQTTLLSITNLPDETLAAVAKFLPKPSRALFAVAMTDPTLFLHKSNWELVSSAATNRAILSLVHRSSNDDDDDSYGLDDMVVDEENSDEDSNYNSDAGGEVIRHEEVVCDYDDDYFYYDDDIEVEDEVQHMSIFGPADDVDVEEDEDEEFYDVEDDDAPDDESWATLDFEEIEESLAAKLSDDDIRGVLICIDGVHRLRTISLCGCVGLTGSGLDPLMGSTMLRSIDLSLVKRTDSPVILPNPNMSEASVIPILRSIVDADGSSLKDILLPYKLQSVIYDVQGGPVRGFHRFVESYYDLGDHKDLIRRILSSRN